MKFVVSWRGVLQDHFQLRHIRTRFGIIKVVPFHFFRQRTSYRQNNFISGVQSNPLFLLVALWFGWNSDEFDGIQVATALVVVRLTPTAITRSTKPKLYTSQIFRTSQTRKKRRMQLLSKFTLGNHVLKNRIVLAPLTRARYVCKCRRLRMVNNIHSDLLTSWSLCLAQM